MGKEELPVQTFPSREELHDWLLAHGESAAGLWVRLFRVKSGIKSVSVLVGVKVSAAATTNSPICRNSRRARLRKPGPSAICSWWKN